MFKTNSGHLQSDLFDLFSFYPKPCWKQMKQSEEYEITPVQTAIRGKSPEVEIEISQQSETEYTVKCHKQKVKSESSRTRYKAEFDRTICGNCPYRGKCPTIVMKHRRVYYFSHAGYVSKKMRKITITLPPERRKLRCNVEATVFLPNSIHCFRKCGICKNGNFLKPCF